MKPNYIVFYITFLLPSLSFGQLKDPDCDYIKTGKFYFYPTTSPKRFLIIRDDVTQKEINLQAGDTSFWKIKWQSSCIITLNFLRKSRPISDEELSFFNAHKTIIKILEIKRDYYVFKGGLDNISSSNVIDTLWFKKRAL